MLTIFQKIAPLCVILSCNVQTYIIEILGISTACLGAWVAHHQSQSRSLVASSSISNIG